MSDVNNLNWFPGPSSSTPLVQNIAPGYLVRSSVLFKDGVIRTVTKVENDTFYFTPKTTNEIDSYFLTSQFEFAKPSTNLEYRVNTQAIEDWFQSASILTVTKEPSSKSWVVLMTDGQEFILPAMFFSKVVEEPKNPYAIVRVQHSANGELIFDRRHSTSSFPWRCAPDCAGYSWEEVTALGDVEIIFPGIEE